MNGSRSAPLVAQLVDIGDCISAAMAEISRDPEPSRLQLMAAMLDGARKHCLLVAESIRIEQIEGTQIA